jgi:hypothetical protein
MSQTTTRAVYLQIFELPDHERPMAVYRRDEERKTIIAVDPRATRFAITQAAVDRLTVAEQNEIRDAMGFARVGEYLPDEFMSDKPCLLYVPPALRVPGDDPLQGGVELARRLACGDLADELRWLEAEQHEMAG